ncbi:MAG: hydroxylamine reductase [Lentisphaerae bacterium]|nr:hydroxylamine reductase [Lentisphaerota bacterium]
MFCYQCQETVRNTACTMKGVCGKEEPTANLQDLLIYILQGLALRIQAAGRPADRRQGLFICQALFSTITNANFDNARIIDLTRQALAMRDELPDAPNLPDCARWQPTEDADFLAKAPAIGILSYSDNEDVRSLKSLLLYGCKGIAAYTDHAAMLDHYDDDIFQFQVRALAAIQQDLGADELTGLVMEAGKTAVAAMALLDKANTSTYGNPEITKVNLGVGKRPGILISGHDLRDMQELLQQTADAGVDVYTHSEMLPAHYYPAFKKYPHLIGNYGSSWWHQDKDFATFNGPILMTTNCIIPVKDEYRDRIFTTGMAGYKGVRHIPDRQNGSPKDFGEIIRLAQTCPPPQELEQGSITGGFAHNQVLALADKVVAAVKSGAIKKFVVMAGCDGRHRTRTYFTEVAQALPSDTVILTAGCAKYRYIKLNLGDIGGIPRVLDAGQCNDSYSLALVALKLKEVFGLDDINQLPLAFDVAWYEQKAVAVLLALLYLGVKGMRLGPTLPAFLSPGVAKVLVDKFDIIPTGEPRADVAAMLA